MSEWAWYRYWRAILYLTKPVLLYGLTFNLVSPKCNTYPCQPGPPGAPPVVRAPAADDDDHLFQSAQGGLAWLLVRAYVDAQVAQHGPADQVQRGVRTWRGWMIVGMKAGWV